MIIFILNIISLTSVFSQFLLVTFYILGILFYKFNKNIAPSLNENQTQLNTKESVEYFSEEVINDLPSKSVDFENYDDYSEFSKEKNTSKSITDIEESEVKISEQEHKTIEVKPSSEIKEDLDEDYVPQNVTPTATVEDEDFEQISFNLPIDQDNSITMVTEEDIRRVFQKQESNDWVVRYQKTNS